MALAKVRPGLPTDADELTELSRSTFIETYAVHNTPEDMALYLRQSLTADQWRDTLRNPAYAVLLLEDDEGLAGYTEVRQGYVPDCVKTARPVELSRLYVRKNRLGKGLGALLMSAAVETARARSATGLWLGVWQKNERAIAFYKKSGFTVVGAQVFPLGKDLQDDWVMMKALNA
jgi:GNAT superfamily N-acetyltransferase